MKVLYMTNYPSPYRVDFFNELGKKCDLTVVFEEAPEAQTHRDMTWFHTDYDFFRAVFIKNTIKVKGHNKLAVGIISEIKKEYDYIIVGVYSTNTAMLAMQYMILHHIPYWIETDGGVAKHGNGLKEKMKYHFISHACGYFSPSAVSDEYLIHYGADKNKIHRYPFTSLHQKDILKKNISDDEKKQIRKRLHIHDDIMILSVGQFIHRKGFDVLLKSAVGMDDRYGIYMIGGSPSEEYLQLRKELKLKEKVHFLSFKKQEELKEYYKAADIFVLPTREDIWGLVINEAMAYGLPVVTTDKCIAGLELVKDNGYIVPADNEAELYAAIQNAICNKKTFSDSSLKNIANYTFENMADTHINVFI